MKKSKKKTLLWILGIVIVCAALFGAYAIMYNVNSKPEVAASTAENCEIIHNLFVQEEDSKKDFKSKFLMDWDEYREGTLYNMGLAADETWKEWNGKWIIDEAFIRTYIATYSAEEFMDVYDLYVNGYTTPWVYKQDETFYDNNAALLAHISETTLLMFDLFEVADYNPSADPVLNTTSKTEPVHGSFNTGSDNHIESMEGERTTDTYEYDGYTVEHVYGDQYDGGQYGWVDGKFVDIDAHFDKINRYYLYVDGQQIMGPVNKMEDLQCRWIVIDGVKYYERVLTGGRITYGSGKSYYIRFEQPVSVLTTSSQDAAEKYIQYE